jgi:hypothetical protein
MEVANVRLVLNKVGSDVPLKDVTPAEAMLLHILHGASNGGKTFGEEFTKIEVIGTAKVETQVPDEVQKAKPAVGEVGKPGYQPAVPEKVLTTKPGLRDRSDVEELNRLRKKYAQARNKENKPIIDSVWPDRFNPKLPQTFKDINWGEVGSSGIEVADVNYATGGLAQKTL